jgi:hypothetical protein
LIPDAELHIFEQCSCQAQRDQAERLNRLMADFLR